MSDPEPAARFIVNSSPGAGLRFEPSKSFANVEAALNWAEALEHRGMRMVRIRDTIAGANFDRRTLRDETKRAHDAARNANDGDGANE